MFKLLIAVYSTDQNLYNYLCIHTIEELREKFLFIYFAQLKSTQKENLYVVQPKGLI